jgi:uncharacterized membrane protein
MANDYKLKRADLLKTQMTTYFDVYKHHMEFFLKVIGLYLAVVSAIVVYVFNKDVTVPTKRLLLLLIIIGSIISSLGCFGAWLWLRKFEEEITKISNELRLSVFPFFGSKNLILLMLVISVGLICVGSVLIIWQNVFLVQ